MTHAASGAAVTALLLLAAAASPPAASAEPDAPMQISVTRANHEPLPILPHQAARIDVDAAANGPRTIRLKKCDAAGCAHVQFEHRTDAQGRHTFFVSPDRTTDYQVGMPPDGKLQGRAQRITVSVAAPPPPPPLPEAQQSIQVFLGARTHQPGHDAAPAGAARSPLEVVASPAQPGRGIQVFRQEIDAAGRPVGAWKPYRRTQQGASGRAFMFVPVPAGAGHQYRYTAHSLAFQGHKRVAAIQHASELTNGWTPLFSDEFVGDRLNAAKWVHRGPLAGPAKDLCDPKDAPPNPDRRAHDFSDDSVTRVRGGVLQLDTRPVRKCTFGPRVRANANLALADGATGQPARLPGDRTYLFAARMKMPHTRGNFPSFWIRAESSTDMGELDIIESFGRLQRPDAWCRPSSPGAAIRRLTPGGQPRTGMLTNVYWTDTPHSGIQRCLGVGELQRLGVPQYDGADRTQFNRYHVYSAVWAPGRHYRVSIDGVLVHEFGPERMSPQPRLAILSNFVNDTRKRLGGNDRAAQVDWVRVWTTP